MYINVASGTLKIGADEIERAVMETAPPKQRGKLVRAAIDMFRPAKRGGNGRILVAGAHEVRRETVEEFPDAAALLELEDDTETESYNGAMLEIRAMDRDKADRGWAGKLHAGAMSTPRMGVTLYPTVDREAIAARKRVRVDALVESRRLDDDTVRPLRIHVIRVIG